tara:strand:+ start:1531 stop:1674 length:144 start_codon:yes stop_codon:yes gene_type:complete
MATKPKTRATAKKAMPKAPAEKAVAPSTPPVGSAEYKSLVLQGKIKE